MITFTVEKVMDSRKEIQPLLEQHYEELTLHKNLVKLDVDWDFYRLTEEKGGLFYLAARENGRLIGYAIFFAKQHVHYKSLKIASNDVLFLDKEHRKGTTGIKLIKRAEQELKAFGVQKVLWHVKQSNETGELLVLLGYNVEDVILGKVLGD